MKFLDVNQHLSELDEHIKVLKSYGDVFEEVEARITRVINMDGAFKGEGAKGVIYNHAHMQLPTIRSIRAFLISFSDTLEKMKANITEYEPASNGSVSEDFWKNQLPKAYDRYEETLEEREAAINQATAEVSHILHLGKLQTGDVYNSVDSARKHADTVLEGLYDLDQAGVELMAQVRTKMEELKATIRQVLDWNMTGGVTMKGVSIMEVGGYFANNATLHEKAPEVDTGKMNANVHDPSLSNLTNYVKMSQATAKLKQGLQVWGRLFQASVFYVFHPTYVEKLISRARSSISQSPKVQTQVQREQELDAIIEERKVVLTLEEEEALKQYLSDPTNFEGKTLIRPADTERPAPHFDSYRKVLGNPNSDVNMLASGHITTATGNFFAEDFITLVDSEASMGEKALAAGFILVKPAKLVDKLLDLNKARKINNSSGSGGSQSSNSSSGSTDKRSTDVSSNEKNTDNISNTNSNVNVSNETIINSASIPKKGGETVVGHALQKHAGRNPDIWGKVKGGPDQINQTAIKHLEEILNGPGDFARVANNRGITFLEKKLADGRGVRLNLDGTFKGFIDQ
ncbi:ribonuclease YeeF family protein [Halalkalibacterium halodurans]|uniref:LXG domain-containing protein n=1 Tax=Halalkalibacterium halodurans TaxID=86665 RepID=A0A0M0KMG0_ALKHA|nr:T7SS effector LXG polymorphic toxin [Halalkalibacterium halodurans]